MPFNLNEARQPPPVPSHPGQHVLERTAVLVSSNGAVEARFTVGLPAQVESVCVLCVIMGLLLVVIFVVVVAQCVDVL